MAANYSNASTVHITLPTTQRGRTTERETIFRCPECPDVFTTRSSQTRHVQNQHERVIKHICPICSMGFGHKDNWTRHMKTHETDGQQKSAVPGLATGPRPQKKRKAGKNESFCLTDSFTSQPSKRRLNAHHSKKRLLDHLSPDFKEIYQKHWNAIKTHKRPGKVQSVYTVFWDPSSDTPDWDEQLWALFHEQNKRFKINFSHSFLLKHKESGGLSFFHACQNNHRALDKPRLISSKPDFLSFLSELNDYDILGHVQRERPNSRYSVQAIMSTSFYVYPLADFPIGCACDDLPDFIANNPFLHTLQRDENHGFWYKDGLCFFRCLALHKGVSPHSLQKTTQTLFQQWSGCALPPLHFTGVTLSELNSIEKKFQMNVDVFEFDQTQAPPVLVPLRRSDYKHTDTLRVLCYKHHFMYIKDIDKLGHALTCSKCGKLYAQLFRLNEHEKTCRGSQTKETFKGGVYTPPTSILQQLCDQGISVDPHFVFPYRATFDFEVFF